MTETGRPELSTVQQGRASAPSGLAAGLGAILAWGLVPVAIRYFVGTTDPLTFGFVRFVAMTLGALPLLIGADLKRWPRRDLLTLVLCATFAVPGLNIPSILSARTLTAGGLGLVSATEPIFIVIFALLLTRTRVGARVMLGGAIALSGVIIAFAPSAGSLLSGQNLPAVGIGLIGAASWALYTIVSAPLSRRYGSRATTGGVLSLGGAMGAVLVAPAVPMHALPGPVELLEIAAMTVTSSVIGFLLWNEAARTMRPAPMGLLLYLLPGIAILGGALLLGEPVPLRDLTGGVLILLGVAIGEGRLRMPILRARSP